MSVKSGLWVQAHLWRCNAQGLSAVLVKRGAEEAGSIYVKINRLNGEVVLLGPAPGPSYDGRGERRWIRLLGNDPVQESDIEKYLGRVKSIDPDIWVIEVEDPKGLGLIIPVEDA